MKALRGTARHLRTSAPPTTQATATSAHGVIAAPETRRKWRRARDSKTHPAAQLGHMKKMRACLWKYFVMPVGSELEGFGHNT